jgi:DNA-binding IclR family transcriptional regulator
MSQTNSTALRAIEILLLFDADRSVWTSNDIADRFGMPRSTAYRYLASLRETGLLESDEGGQYRLGSRILALARVARKGITILGIAERHLQQLQSETDETVLLSRRQGPTVIVVECLDSRHNVRITFDRGHILPNPATASAKVLLAHAPEDEVTAMLGAQPLTKYTERTLTSRSAIRKQLQHVRAQGYAVNDGEADEGVRAVAAPIFNARREVSYSVGVVGPAFRLTDRRLSQAILAVKRAGAAISEALLDRG